MTDKEIISAILRELPVGYIPSHTPESLPEKVRFYVTEYNRLHCVGDGRECLQFEGATPEAETKIETEK